VTWKQAVGRLLPPGIALQARATHGNSREPELRALHRFVGKGDTVVDIGAHKGMYTYWLWRLVGPRGSVRAYEPQPDLADQLRRGLAGRRFANVTVSQAALSSRRGTARLSVPVEDGRRIIGHASLLQHGDDPTAATFEVETVPLDEEGLAGVSFVKCDVEGFELDVLEGARGLLAAAHPTLLVEVEHRHAGGRVGDTLALLSEHGYSPYYLGEDGRLLPVPQRHRDTPELLNQVEDGRYVNNFFFVHETQRERCR
jgi:FkbM family methyltransferase